MANDRRPGEIDLPKGTRLLDRYSILDRVDSGGMATIYRAKDERLDRVVCVKLLRTTIVDGTAASTNGRAVYRATYSHFLQEALALSKLSHPNTLRIYDFGYLDPSAADDAREGSGAPFHVSEYLDGGNLESHVRTRGPLRPAEMLEILERITGAIAEAHDVGIIHRDIKPSNILFARVREELVPKLADFGIAQNGLRKSGPGGDDNQSISTVALFSPRWAAPEQLCGSKEGPATDVYALALVVVFMLTGQFLFDDANVRETFDRRVRDDRLVRTRLEDVADLLPKGGRWTDVLVSALASRQSERIATAPEFFTRLRDALEEQEQSEAAPAPPQAFLLPPAIEPYPLPSSRDDSSVTVELRDVQAELVSRRTESAATKGPRNVRLAQVHEKLDLSFATSAGIQVRVRVTMLPTEGSRGSKLLIKGLTCFVGKRGQRPSPAITLDREGSVDLVSSKRELLDELSCSFGREGQGGWLFVVDGRQLLIPYSEARETVALTLASGQDIIVMCRRS